VSEHISFVVNGTPRELDVEPRRLLVQAIREDLDLTGTHVGCDTSQCGACTVHVDGMAMKLAVAGNRELQVVRKRVHHGDAHPVQPAGDLVGAVVELPARVQHRHDDLGRRAPLFGVDIHRDAAPVIGDGHGFIGMNGHEDSVAVTGERLVDGVVHHLENHVVETRAVIGVADVHAGAFPHRVKTF